MVGVRRLVSLVLFWQLSLIAQAQQPRDTKPSVAPVVAQLEQGVVDVIARTEPSVVAISRTSRPQGGAVALRADDLFAELRENTPRDSEPVTVGAGVIIDPAGLVLTHYLAVREGEQHSVTTIDRSTYRASIRAADPRSGLAVLAIETGANSPRRAGERATKAAPGSFPAMRFGDAADLRKGQFVVAIGNPYAIQTDGQPTASWGRVTNLARKAPSGTNLNDAPGPAGDFRTTLHHLGTLIQTDARLGFSAAGGALVNMQGELIGVTTTAAAIAGHEQPAGYAIPINAPIRRIIEALKQGREVEYGMLGIGFGALAFGGQEGTRARLSVVQVIPGSPAAQAGIETADVITGVGGRPVDSVDAVQLAIGMLPPATVTTVEYRRGGQRQTASVTLAKQAVAGKKIASVRPESWHGLRVDYVTVLDGSELAEAVASGAYDSQGCVVVTDVEENSVAWKVGVRKGMFVSHVGKKRVTSPADFAAAARQLGNAFDIRLTKPVLPPAKQSDVPRKPQ